MKRLDKVVLKDYEDSPTMLVQRIVENAGIRHINVIWFNTLCELQAAQFNEDMLELDT